MGSQNMHDGVEEETAHLRGSAGDTERPAKKSKGGRKLIYATLEQRKQRNRDAQAAFRERRSEHITELEKTVQEQKIKLQASQAAHTSAKDECLLLRYKNSLLERILLEKGIDVNSELNNILEVRPQQHSISQRQNHVRPITKNTASNAPPALDTNIPPSPTKPSRCCDHCSAPQRNRTFTPQLTPISNGFSPIIETKAVDKRPLSQDTTHFASVHPHKRPRHSTHFTGHHSGGSSMMRKYNMHQSFPYPQAPYSLAPDTQVTRMNARAQAAFEERISHEALYTSPTSVDPLDQCVNHGAEVIDDHEESDGNTARSSRAHSAYSPPDYPPMQMQPPYFKNSKILDFDHPPMTQFMGSYDPNFELDLEFLSSIQA